MIALSSVPLGPSSKRAKCSFCGLLLYTMGIQHSGVNYFVKNRKAAPSDPDPLCSV